MTELWRIIYLDYCSAYRAVSLIQNYIAVIFQDLPSQENKLQVLKVYIIYSHMFFFKCNLIAFIVYHQYWTHRERHAIGTAWMSININLNKNCFRRILYKIAFVTCYVSNFKITVWLLKKISFVSMIKYPDVIEQNLTIKVLHVVVIIRETVNCSNYFLLNYTIANNNNV